jgi:hypothetical protein
MDTLVHCAAAMKTRLLGCSILGLCIATAGGTAFADDDVDPVSGEDDGLVAVQRGVQGPKGMFSARITLGINLSAELVGKPISLVPDVFYSFTDKLQLGIVHDGPMGWQTKPGLGLCLTGEDAGCPRVYDNIGLDAMYGVAFMEPLHLSAHGTFYVDSFDAGSMSVALGAAGKLHFNPSMSLYFDPQLAFALNDRDVREDALYVPLELQFQVGAPTTLKLLTGMSGSLSAFGDTLAVPVGLGVVRNITPNIDVGGRFSFDNLLGHQPDGVDRADTRSLAILLILRN